MRSIGMDVHRDFCEIAIAEGGSVRAAGRIATEPEALALFARSLVSTDEVAIEGLPMRSRSPGSSSRMFGGQCWPTQGGAREVARAKTDRIDAQVLARLLAVGVLDQVWTPDDETQTRRRLITRRCALVRARTRAKSQICAVFQATARAAADE